MKFVLKALIPLAAIVALLYYLRHPISMQDLQNSSEVDVSQTKDSEHGNDENPRVNISIREIVQKSSKKELNEISEETAISTQAVYSEREVPTGNPDRILTGSFPSINADYRRFIGFGGYCDAIRRVGGKFFVYNNYSRSIEKEIDSKDFRLTDITTTNGLSPRSRIISGEPGINNLLESYRNAAPGRYSAILLFPSKLDVFIINTLSSTVIKNGYSLDDINDFNGVYKPSGKKIVLEIYEATTNQGGKINLNVELKI